MFDSMGDGGDPDKGQSRSLLISTERASHAPTEPPKASMLTSVQQATTEQAESATMSPTSDLDGEIMQDPAGTSLDKKRASHESRRSNFMRRLSTFTSREGSDEPWLFTIGWNRFVNPETGKPDEPTDQRFRGNQIQSSKYTLLNFVPYNLFHQVCKGPNIYYLGICVLQMIKPISITNGQPTNLPPLLFLMAISMIKDFIEDSRRRQSDKKENCAKTLRYEPAGDSSSLSREQPTSPASASLLGSGGCEPCEVEWQKVRVGDILKVRKNESFPADLVLLMSSEPKNICFVETKSLDGETNLKHKVAADLPKFESEGDLVRGLRGDVHCELPNDKIYSFEGFVRAQQDSGKISLSHENLLLRGSSLRNTDWVVGVATYTGHDTRIMRNSVHSKQKFSRLEKMITVSILVIFLIECVFVTFGSAYATGWTERNCVGTNSYLDFEATPGYDDSWTFGVYLKTFFLSFGTEVILFTNLVPISLLVTLEVVKYAQSVFIQWDINVYDQQRDMPTRVQSSNLNEELGQVSQLFSDKTGTLTCNVMQFKKFSAGLRSYGQEREPTQGSNRLSGSQDVQSAQQEAIKVPNVDFFDESFQRDYASSDSPSHAHIHRMLLNMALNHTVVVEAPKNEPEEPTAGPAQQEEQEEARLLRPDTSASDTHGMLINKSDVTLRAKKSTQNYNASSPDELALVSGAKFLGIEFEGRDATDNNVLVLSSKGVNQKYELLNTIEFNSTRKRMTSVVRTADGRILVMCKGADSVLIPLIGDRKSPDVESLLERTISFMDCYAKEGLRTLLFVEKEISDEEYSEWNAKYQTALTSLEDREGKIDKCATELEHSFQLVGSTAIEDKLQDFVPETIKLVKDAGIKIWVLTGDKIETAINIGLGCNLLDDKIVQYIIDGSRSMQIFKQMALAENRQNLTIGRQRLALIVSGEALLKIMASDSLKDKFTKLVSKAEIVLACRVSPKQKAEIVQMSRQQNPQHVTLAIGDGANDVNMITAAHVGVGIQGLEGMQAARASDYCISQFSFLQSLMFYHGREAYRRNATLAIYMFYKNALFVMPLFWFGFVSAFSGQTLYESVLYQLYNIVFTAFPIMWFAIFDEEFPKHVYLAEPHHYRIGMQDAYYSYKLLVQNQFRAVAQGFFVFAFTYFALDGSKVQGDGKDMGFWFAGNTLYGSIVIVGNVWILQRTSTHTVVSVVLCVLSILSFFFCYWFVSAFFKYGSDYKLFGENMSTGLTYLSMLLAAWWNAFVDFLVARFLEYQQERALAKAAHSQVSASHGGSSFTVTQQGKLSEISHDFSVTESVVVGNSDPNSIHTISDSPVHDNQTPVLKERQDTLHGYAFSQDESNEKILIDSSRSRRTSAKHVVPERDFANTHCGKPIVSSMDHISSQNNSIEHDC